MFRTLLKSAVAGLTIACAGQTDAAIIKVDLSGSLYQVSGSVASQFSVGDRILASFVYDSSAVGLPWYPGGVLDPHFRFYPSAALGGYLIVNNYLVTFGPAPRMFVSDDEPVGPTVIDRLILDDYGAHAAPVNGLGFNEFFFNWQDSGAHASDGLTLPTSQAGFDAYGFPTGAIDWATNDAANRVTFAFSSVAVTVAGVPEPAEWSMMLLGFLVLGLAARRQVLQTGRMGQISTS